MKMTRKMAPKKILTFALFISAAIGLRAQSQDLVKYVNTLQGTDSKMEFSQGNVFPSVTMPYGMNAWTPQTGKNGNGWRYQYTASKIRAFSEAHQCSPWMSDYGVYSFMPVVGNLVVNEDDRATNFSHSNETAKPNYYKVTLANGITTEISPSTRGAHLRFSYPSKGEAYLVIDGYTGRSEIDIDPAKRQITGWVDNVWHTYDPASFRNWFVIQFDKDFTDYGTWENVKNSIQPKALKGTGKGFGAFVKFKKGTKVQVKTASSYISLDQAIFNMESELGPDKTLEATKERSGKAWNELLNKVLVEGGDEEQTKTFYSCLFRANLFSRMFYELKPDGTPHYYSPFDGKVHDGYMYTDNGFWDTFRSQFPLTLILHPQMQGRYMKALMDAYDQSGWMPAWCAPGESGVMLGNHAISLLTDAWAKGVRTFDPHKALEAYYHEITNIGPWKGSNGRPGWKDYFTLGYVTDKEDASAAKTLEYAYDDFCAYRLAEMTGDTFYKNIFGKLMYNYRNLFDSATGFMRGKDADGKWTKPFDPLSWGGAYCEGNAWHYSWSVFQDIQGLINLFGGNEKFVAKMDSVFTIPNTIVVGTYGQVIHEMAEMAAGNMGQYAQGNQPIQHMPYLYCYAGQPWKTQYWVRQIMDRLYNSTPKGFPGDEDEGAMSAWYVLGAMGFYAVTPGTDQYVLGSPMFKKMTLTLDNGNKFIVEAENNSKQNVYIQTATLNGERLDRNYITYDEIMKGGKMHFRMGPQPSKSRGVSPSSVPFSLTEIDAEPADYVNPFIGTCSENGYLWLTDKNDPNLDTLVSLKELSKTHGTGKTFPGADTPFGMVQVSPNTITGGDHASGYNYHDKTIEGFSFGHINGTGWGGELGNFLVMPTTGALKTIAGLENHKIEGYRSYFDKGTETAKPGYYSVDLTRYGIKTECSSTPRCGILRFTYPSSEKSRVQIDLARRINGSATEEYIQVIDSHTIKGWIKCSEMTGGWGNGEGHCNYTFYFYATLSEPLSDYGFWSADIPDGWSRKNNDVEKVEYLKQVEKAPLIKGKKEIQGKHIGFYCDFPTTSGEQVTMKVGVSYVDMEGAENNYRKEIASKDFDQVASEARELWNKELGKISVSGKSSEDKTIFYTALYHTMMDPRIFQDCDGRYFGGDLKIHKSDGSYNKRTIFSGWDVFRNVFPLYTIINPQVVNDQVNTFISLAEESGHKYYERWELMNAYSGCMVGNPAISVIADAYLKGIRGFDANKALQFSINTSKTFGNDKLGYSTGYFGVSQTLEYAYTDWCISQLANSLGDSKTAKDYAVKGQAYKNLFNKDVNWFRGKDENGNWAKWNGRLQIGDGCIESDLYQQGWFVPQDPDGLAGLLGGKDNAIADLNDMFVKTPNFRYWNDYFNLSNEIVHLAPYLFNRFGTPYLTQKWTKSICEQAYSNGVEGIVGNDDLGQMSAWYVMAATGIGTSCPGSTRMEITSPIFDKIVFNLDQKYYLGKTFTVIAHNNSKENKYIVKAKLNGKDYDKCYIDFSDIAAGGVLELFMDSKPCGWGSTNPFHPIGEI